MLLMLLTMMLMIAIALTSPKAHTRLEMGSTDDIKRLFEPCQWLYMCMMHADTSAHGFQWDIGVHVHVVEEILERGRDCLSFLRVVVV